MCVFRAGKNYIFFLLQFNTSVAVIEMKDHLLCFFMQIVFLYLQSGREKHSLFE